MKELVGAKALADTAKAAKRAATFMMIYIGSDVVVIPNTNSELADYSVLVCASKEQASDTVEDGADADDSVWTVLRE